MRNKLTTYYKDKAGNEIIETQTYYTQPENDWEFDEDQKLSYNNPVFIELLKRRGKNFDELNTGWVPQHKIGEEPEEEDEEIEEAEDEFEEDEDINEEDLFTSAPKMEAPPKKEEDSNEVSFKFSRKSKPEKPAAPASVESPDLGLSGLEAMFGPSTSSTPEPPAPSQPNFGQPSNRDRIGAALNEVQGGKPKLKLNIDKTSADQPMKPTIKLNIKPKDQQ